MNKPAKVFFGFFAIIFLVMNAFVITFFVSLYKTSKKPLVPTDYYETVATGGELEKKYMAPGTLEVSCKDDYNEEESVFHKIWYPSELENASQSYPLIVMVNGIGITAGKCKTAYEHLASWGFVVVCDETVSASSAPSEVALADLSAMLAYNEDKESIFYQKIDTEHIGIAGHSQGGFGAICAALDEEMGSHFQAVCTMSGMTETMLKDCKLDEKWGTYDLTKLTQPILTIAGTGNTDAKTVTPLSDMQANFERIPENVRAVMARRKDADHGAMLYTGDGYVTAWFCYWLKGDEDAGKAFFGETPEIEANGLWQDVQRQGE